MSVYASLARQLDTSRRLEEELALQRHNQGIERNKLQQEMDYLRRSRKQFVEDQLALSQQEYEKKLQEDPEVTKQFLDKQKRVDRDRAKQAREDFETERKRLLQERSNHDITDQKLRLVERSIKDWEVKCRLAYEAQERRLKELEARQASTIKLLNEARHREMVHFDKAKQFNALL